MTVMINRRTDQWGFIGSVEKTIVNQGIWGLEYLLARTIKNCRPKESDQIALERIQRTNSNLYDYQEHSSTHCYF